MPPMVLEAFAQVPLSIYTQICFCFSLKESERQQHEIVASLEKGLGQLAAAFPWISGKVVKDPDSGLFVVKNHHSAPQLVVKDYGHSGPAPTFKKLQDSGFPCSLLDETLVAPRSTTPGVFSESLDEPVFIVQATFVDQGLLLTFLAHHQVMDGTGEAQMVYLLSKACRGEEFTLEELKNGNLDREHLVPLFSEQETAAYGDFTTRLVHQIVNVNKKPANTTSETVFWATLEFSASALAELKQRASAELSGVPFVSTDDALTAFLWAAISRARLPRVSPKSASLMARAVNVRPYLGIPANFPGVINNMTYTEQTIGELANLPLGTLASRLRAKLTGPNATLAQDSRALATLITATQKHPITSATATLDDSTGLALSSWAAQNSYLVDFGFGRPECVRRPQFTPVESLIYILPRELSGGVGVMVCLRDSDWKNMRSDTEVKKYARYVV